jgi:hypothetical protein
VLKLHDLRRSVQVALEGAQGADRGGLAMTYGSFLIGNAISSLLAIDEWVQAESLLYDAIAGATEPVAEANLLVSSVVIAAWRSQRSRVNRDLARIDAVLERGGHADMRSRLAVAAAEAAIWCREYPAGLRYLHAAAETDADTDDIEMRTHVASVGLRLLICGMRQPRPGNLCQRRIGLAMPGCGWPRHCSRARENGSEHRQNSVPSSSPHSSSSAPRPPSCTSRTSWPS